MSALVELIHVFTYRPFSTHVKFQVIWTSLHIQQDHPTSILLSGHTGGNVSQIQGINVTCPPGKEFMEIIWNGEAELGR